MTSNGYYTANEVISEVTGLNDDGTMRRGLGVGWYTEQVKNALEELAFNIFFDEQTHDFGFPSKTFRMQLPEGTFNIREMYLFNKECCGAGSGSVKVYWKRLFKQISKTGNRGVAGSYTANVKEAGAGNSNIVEGWGDPYFGSYFGDGLETVRYYGIQDGNIVFSSNCTGFDSVRLVVNGMGVGHLGDAPIVPRMYKNYCVYYVLDRYYNRMKSKDRNYRTDYADNLVRLTDEGRKARVRRISMDTAARADLCLYMTNFQF